MSLKQWSNMKKLCCSRRRIEGVTRKNIEGGATPEGMNQKNLLGELPQKGGGVFRGGSNIKRNNNSIPQYVIFM